MFVRPLGVAGGYSRVVRGRMSVSDGLAAGELQRGCDQHSQGFDNLQKAMTCTQSLCFLEVTTTLAMLTKTAGASDKQSRWRQTCATMGPSSLFGLRDATNRIAARRHSPGSALPSEAVARIEVPGLGHRGQNAGPAAGGPNTANQGVYAAKGAFFMSHTSR